MGSLRRRVGRERGFDEGELTAVFSGRRLDDGLTLSDYNIRTESCVLMQVSLSLSLSFRLSDYDIHPACRTTMSHPACPTTM